MDGLALADIALPTFPDEQMLFGDASPGATLERIAALGPREIVVKNGESSALVHHGGTTADVPARAVRALDTTGAGDAFNGGYLAARLAGDEPARAAERAHAVAAAVVQVKGALAPFSMLQDAFAA